MNLEEHTFSFFEELTNPDSVQRHIIQGSDAWDEIRCGRFTASEIYRLMEPSKREMTAEELKARPKKGVGSSVKYAVDHSKLSDAALTYVKQKVAERLTGRVKQSSYAYPLIYGKEMEQEAVDYFQKITGLECEEIGFCPFTDHAGGSPDRDIPKDNSFLEVKCPFQSENHIDHLMLTDWYDLKGIYPDKYWQVQANLLFSGRGQAHWISYDPRFKDEKLKMMHLIVPVVPDDQDLIIHKIELAVKELLSTIQLLTT